MSNRAGENDEIKTIISVDVNPSTFQLIQPPKLPKRFEDRIADQMYDEFVLICRDSVITDYGNSEEFKQSMKIQRHQLYCIFFIMFLAAGLIFGGSPLMSKNENNTKSWQFILGVTMMIFGVILFLVAIVLYQKTQTGDERKRGLKMAIQNNMRENLKTLNDKYKNKIYFKVMDFMDYTNAVKIYIEIEFKVEKVEWIS